jgi:hypothetical protein
MSTLSEDSINFGKYKDLTIQHVLKDRKYCKWLLQQDWFPKQYEYLYNKVKNYEPKTYFVSKPKFPIGCACTLNEFIDRYEYFHLTPLENLKLSLTDTEKTCYAYYLKMIESLKEKILDCKMANPYDIKAPSSWLGAFEKIHGVSRDVFKEFLSSYELPNIPYIVQDIKKMGGIEYKGAQSFIIAKQNSLKQEEYWEHTLKNLYGETIFSQYKFKNCIFDFINIRTNTLYECKLGLKDFNEEQYKKYMAIVGCFSLVYLIGSDCVIDLDAKEIYTTVPELYKKYLLAVKEPSKFEVLIKDFPIIKVDSITNYFKK